MRLFCYGTLQFPAVMERVCGNHYPGVPAVLENFVCYTLREHSYPGIRPQPGASTPGLLYTGLGQAQLARLDAFENDCYRRERVVVSDAAERSCAAWAYVLQPQAYRLLSGEDWDRAWFERFYLRDYLQSIVPLQDD
jgi:gamma-glutamylcyclotransferase (GGCT)/AIG2-like uncharacterized protein YtfP